MSVFVNYLTMERRAARGAVRLFGAARRSLLGAVRGAAFWLRRRYTIVFMPHDHRDSLSFSFSAGSFAAVACLLSASALLVPLFRSSASDRSERLTETAAAFAEVRKSADLLRDEIGALSSGSQDFAAAIGRVDTALARLEIRSDDPSSKGFFSFLPFDFLHRGESSELQWLISERKRLDASTVRLVAAGNAVKNIRDSLEGIPTVWPVRGGIGHVSQPFGKNPNPFTGIPYLHKGMDVSTYRSGDPIVATADGIVVSAYYDSISGYGNNVTIDHQYGYSTRFGHMMAFRVRAGQQVKQGDVIGYIGNTGLSTGPHVHYEIQLGPDLLDPQGMIIASGKK
jgi:murein DD-endopeptidase MepM/ murein hydrolase activator NlpD